MDEREEVPFYDRHTSAPRSRTHISTRSRPACPFRARTVENRGTLGFRPWCMIPGRLAAHANGPYRCTRISTTRLTGQVHTQGSVRCFRRTHPKHDGSEPRPPKTESKALSRVRGRCNEDGRTQATVDASLQNPPNPRSDRPAPWTHPAPPGHGLAGQAGERREARYLRSEGVV